MKEGGQAPKKEIKKMKARTTKEYLSLLEEAAGVLEDIQSSDQTEYLSEFDRTLTEVLRQIYEQIDSL